MQNKYVKKVVRFETSLTIMETAADKERGNKEIIRNYKGKEKEIMSEKDNGSNNSNVNVVKINTFLMKEEMAAKLKQKRK